jgi:DNA repair protein RadC
MKICVKANASGLALCHNHPSGNTNPSQQDDFVTRKVAKACEILDLNLLDHIVLSDESYLSYADESRL